MRTVVIAFVLAVSVSAQAGAQNVLYRTSFEDFDSAPIKAVAVGPVTWSAVGNAEVLEKFSRTGKKSLHIFGGQNNSLEMRLEGALQRSRGVRFHAERWTRRDPFRFRIDAKIQGQWNQVEQLDQLVLVGRGFRSEVILALPTGDISALRFTVTAPANAGVLIDDLSLLKQKPKDVTRVPRVATEPIRRLISKQDLFVSGTEKTHTFRIPAIITAANGDLVACCDARRKSGADLIWVRDIDIVAKRSNDNGKTWTEMETVCDYGDGRPASDPSLILDRTSGEIFCFYNYMDQDNAPKEFRLYVQSSKDHGKTWSKGRDITGQISKPAWKMDFKFITSGRGIQRRNGHLLHTLVNLKNGLHLFGSKDHGKSWQLFDKPIVPGNESKVIELADETLMVNCRVNDRSGSRWVHRSNDNGKTWQSKAERSLVDPGCNGSIIRYSSTADASKKNRLLFCNSSSFKGRKNLAVRISYDEGRSWSAGKVIDPGPSAYSSLTVLKDGSIGVLYEPGYKTVRFTRFTLEDLTDGQDKP